MPPADYFPETYELARAGFRESAQALLRERPDGSLDALPLTDAELSIELLYLPPPESAPSHALLVVTSGVHGMEAFVGSALQRVLIDDRSFQHPSLAVLFVHAVNPWGFQNRRRGNRDNIDLNRNLALDESLFASENAPYRDLVNALNPSEPATQADVDGIMDRLIGVAVNVPRAELQQAITQGQYEFPQGLYFGGRGFVAQKAALEEVLRTHVAESSSVLLLDFHTGFGERGALQLFGSPGVGDQAALAKVFEGYEVDLGQDPDAFYETTGDLPQYLGALCEQLGVRYVGMTIEYGTLDSQTDIGALRSLANLVLENQGYHHGYASDAVRATVEEQFAEMFYPSEQAWRDKVMADSRAALPVFIRRFAELSP